MRFQEFHVIFFHLHLLSSDMLQTAVKVTLRQVIYLADTTHLPTKTRHLLQLLLLRSTFGQICKALVKVGPIWTLNKYIQVNNIPTTKHTNLWTFQREYHQSVFLK